MSAPHVAGAFAALKSAAPEAAPAEMIEALRQSGLAVLDKRNGRSNPRIRVDKAIEALQKIIAARAAKSKPEAKPEPKAKSGVGSIDGIRIENGEAPIGEEGRIEW